MQWVSGIRFLSGVIVGWIRSYGRLVGADSCSFGSGEEPELCGWAHSNLSSLQWELSHGLNSNWIGGPAEDGGEDKEGRDDINYLYK